MSGVYIKRLTLRNWLCFRGEHVLNLTDQAYSLYAEDTENPDRSNWLGKTAIVEAPAFVLFGRHRKRHEDDIITYGEPGAEVRMEMSDGSWAQRHRARGKATALLFGTEPYEDGKRDGVLKGDAAQKEILSRLALTEDDFLASSWFEQRKMARIVLARPSERMEVVGGWLELAPLESAEDRAAEMAAMQSARLESARSGLKEAEERFQSYEEQLATTTITDADIETLEKAVRDATFDLERAAAAAKRTNAQARWDQLVEAGTALRAQCQADNLPKLVEQHKSASDERTTAAEKLGASKRSLEQANALCAGKFSGTCPVNKRVCPVTDEINAATSLAEKNLTGERAKFHEADVTFQSVVSRERTSLALVGEAQRRIERLNAMRQEGVALKADIESVAGATTLTPEDARRHLDTVRNALEDARRRRADGVGLRTSAAKWSAAISQHTIDIAAHEKALHVALAAARIFGKHGAQRIVATTALAEIGAGANGMLEEAGIPLRVDFTWASEGNGLAKQCGRCGSPFPTSTKVKACERCGDQRGQHLISRLDLELSDRSGAAEDLAGVAVQLSAAAWLRRARGSSWSCALIDEPFGMLDASNRRALSTHLAALLRGRYGFSQAIVVAHQPGVLSAFPGRIEIKRTPSGSVVRVAS